MVKKETAGTNYQQSRLKRKKLLTALLAVFSLVFAFSAYKVVTILSNYNESESEYTDIKEQTVTEVDRSDIPDEISGHTSKFLQVDHLTLRKQNSDYCGWLHIPNNDKVSYPVMRANDNDYYLHRTFEKKYLFAGSLFMDYRNKGDFSSPVTIIYGHSMTNRTMFGSLRYWKNKSYFTDHPVVHLYKDGKLYIYKIFAFLDTVSYSKAYTFNFSDEQAVQNYIDMLRSNSMYDTGVKPTSDQKIICLSTCNGDGSKRWFLAAALTSEIEL